MKLSENRRRMFDAAIIEDCNGCYVYQPYWRTKGPGSLLFPLGHDKYVSARKLIFWRHCPGYRGNLWVTCGNQRCVTFGHMTTKRPLWFRAPKNRWTEEAVTKRFLGDCVPDGECLLFRPHCRQPYPDFNFAHNEKMSGHRYAWTRCFGEIPDGAMVCHHCDTPKCVNPYHLFLGYSENNLKDAVEKGRHHGPVNQGHALWQKIGKNIRSRPCVYLECKRCGQAFLRKSFIYISMLRKLTATLNYCCRSCWLADRREKHRPFTFSDRQARTDLLRIVVARLAVLETSNRLALQRTQVQLTRHTADSSTSAHDAERQG